MRWALVGYFACVFCGCLCRSFGVIFCFVFVFVNGGIIVGAYVGVLGVCAFLRVMCVYFGGVFVLGCGQGWWLGCVMCGRAGQWAGLVNWAVGTPYVCSLNAPVALINLEKIKFIYINGKYI